MAEDNNLNKDLPPQVDSSPVRLNPKRQYLLAAITGILYGFLMVGMFGWGLRNMLQNHSGLATFAFLVLVPIGIGVLTTHSVASKRPVITAIIVTVIFLVAATFVYSGIFFCVLIAAPLWVIPTIIGVILVKLFQRYTKNRNHHRAFVGIMLALPLVFAPIESYISAPDWSRVIEDSIIIDGTPEEVWQHIIRMDEITPQEQRPSLYHTLGVPRPVRATLDREAVGGVRIGEFEFGLTFHEIITVWKPNQAVYFDVDVYTNTRDTDILKQIGGKYFDISNAGYDIEALQNGQVRLHLNSTYRLSTHFNAYGALWSDWILRDFQGYVLQTVKTRVENR